MAYRVSQKMLFLICPKSDIFFKIFQIWLAHTITKWWIFGYLKQKRHTFFINFWDKWAQSQKCKKKWLLWFLRKIFKKFSSTSTFWAIAPTCMVQIGKTFFSLESLDSADFKTAISFKIWVSFNSKILDWRTILVQKHGLTLKSQIFKISFLMCSS